MRRTFCIALLLLAVEAGASTTTGALRGRVKSEGQPVSGVRVVASCYASAGAAETLSTDAGEYWFPALTPGACEVTFSRSGLQTLTQRTEIEAGTEVRADVAVAASTEGEQVTATSVKRSFLENAEPVWKVNEDLTAFLPHRRSIDAVRALGPRFADASGTGSIYVEGIERLGATRAGIVDAFGPVTSVIAGAPADFAASGGRLEFVSLRSRSLFDASLRLTGERQDRTTKAAAEITVGGVPDEHVNVFAAYRRGALHDLLPDDQWLGAVDFAPRADLSMRGVMLGDDGKFDWSYRAAFVIGEQVTVDGDVSEGDARNAGVRAGWLVAVGPGVHELRAGVERREQGTSNDVWFVRDHWTASDRWSVDGGLRMDNERSLPRFGLMFDPEGEGVRRVSASYGEYSDPGSEGELRESALSYATQWAGSVWWSGTLLHRAPSTGPSLTGVVLDVTYRYLIFNFGGNASVGRRAGETEKTANAWVVADAPLLEHDVNVALVERVRDDFLATDVAVTYSWTLGRIAPLAKFEVENVFGRKGDGRFDDARPRAIRLGIGVRFTQE